MGYSISWLACQGVSPAILNQRLGLSGTRQLGDYPDSPIVGRELPGDWYLIVADRCDHPIISDPVLSTVSAGCVTVTCSIEEHVMFSAAALWRDGTLLWRVQHQAEIATTDISVTGTPPDEFQSIRDDFARKQAEEHARIDPQVDWYFEIPLSLARHLVGFQHDERTPGVEDGCFEILSPIKDGLATPKRSWWRFW